MCVAGAARADKGYSPHFKHLEVGEEVEITGSQTATITSIEGGVVMARIGKGRGQRALRKSELSRADQRRWPVRSSK